MEEKDLETKLQELRSQPQIKCMHKIELLQEHTNSWKANGLSSFSHREEFRIVKVDCPTPYSIKITVDLMLNDHWTDKECVE